MSYFDDGKGREGFTPLDRCYRHLSCALVAEHGGGCDPRPEPQRVAALMYILRRVGEDYDQIEGIVEKEAHAALVIAENAARRAWWRRSPMAGARA